MSNPHHLPNTPPQDETQPNLSQYSLSDDTSPLGATRPRRPHRRARYLLMTLIILTIASLTATLGLLIATSRQTTPTIAPTQTVRVNLIHNGEEITLSTSAATVAELLTQQGITLQPEDAISYPPQTLLTPDMTLIIAPARTVTLTLDGITRTLRTPFTSPYDVLNQANIALQASDSLWLDGIPTAPDAILNHPQAVQDIVIQRILEITITDGDQIQTLQTSATTVSQALADADLELYLADTVTPALDAPLTRDTTITIQRATPITIQADGEIIETRVSATTIGEALAQAGVVLGGLDYVLPPEDDPITPDMRLQVVRVTQETITVEEAIPYETTYQADANLELDARAVLQAGQTGTRQIEINVRYGDGVEIGREIVATRITRQPSPQIIGYGTRITLRTVETPEGTREYWRHLRAYATSYHPAAFGVTTATTSIGEVLRTGIIAADPRIIPYRTNMYVPNYGIGIMADTGGPRSSPYWVDLGYSDEDWVSWSRYVDVYLLTPVPDNINYLLPEWTPIRGQTPP